jgi:outer membrane protein assembly factor BamB
MGNGGFQRIWGGFFFKRAVLAGCLTALTVLAGCEPKSPVPPTGIQPVWKERLTEANGPVGVDSANLLLVTRDYSPRVVALDAETRKERWHFDFPDRHRFYFIGQADGVAVASASNWEDANKPTQTYGLDAASGRELWRFEGFEGVPEIRGGRLVAKLTVKDKPGRVYRALDLKTGKELYKFSSDPADWKATVPDISNSFGMLNQDGLGALVITKGKKSPAQVLFFDGSATTPKGVPVTLPNGDGADSYIDGSTLYWATFTATEKAKLILQAFELQTGRKKWQVELPGPAAALGNSPKFIGLANGLVVLADHQEKMYGLDAATGATKWTAPISAIEQTEVDEIVRDGGRNFVVSADPLKSKTVIVRDAADGRELWKGTFPEPEIAKRIEARNGMLYIRTEQNELVSRYLNVQRQVYAALYAFDLKDGKLAWRHVGATIDSVDYFKDWVLIRAGKEMLALPGK